MAKDVKKEEVEEQKLVALEMTADEKAEYIKWKADQQEEKAKALKAKDVVQINPKNSHQINGVIYAKGGTYLVTREIAEGILVQDELATTSYMKQFVENKKDIEILLSGRARIVNTAGSLGA